MKIFTTVLVACSFSYVMTGCTQLHTHHSHQTAHSISHKVAYATPKQFESIEWELVSISGDQIKTAKRPTLQLIDQKVSGFTGCNRLMGSYSLVDTGFKISPNLATTRMACLDEATNKLEQSYLRLLPMTTTVKVINNQLVLDVGEHEMIFNPKK